MRSLALAPVMNALTLAMTMPERVWGGLRDHLRGVFKIIAWRSHAEWAVLLESGKKMGDSVPKDTMGSVHSRTYAKRGYAGFFGWLAT